MVFQLLTGSTAAYIVELPTSSAIAINFAWFITSSFAFRTQFGVAVWLTARGCGIRRPLLLIKVALGESP